MLVLENIHGYALSNQVGHKVFHPASYNPVIFAPHLLDIDSLCDADINDSKSDIIAFNSITSLKNSGKRVISSICRPEKIYSSLEFIKNISLILSSRADFIFCCTVKSSQEINLIKDKIKQINPTILGQIFFVKWTQKVDKLLELTDIFIDTYPFGCGITLLQAMKHSCLILIPLANKEKFVNIQSNPGNISQDLCENDPHLRHIAFSICKQIKDNSMIHFFQSMNFDDFDMSELEKYFGESDATKNINASNRTSILKKLLSNYDQMSNLISSIIK